MWWQQLTDRLDICQGVESSSITLSSVKDFPTYFQRERKIWDGHIKFLLVEYAHGIQITAALDADPTSYPILRQLVDCAKDMVLWMEASLGNSLTRPSND